MDIVLFNALGAFLGVVWYSNKALLDLNLGALSVLHYGEHSSTLLALDDFFLSRLDVAVLDGVLGTLSFFEMVSGRADLAGSSVLVHSLAEIDVLDTLLGSFLDDKSISRLACKALVLLSIKSHAVDNLDGIVVGNAFVISHVVGSVNTSYTGWLLKGISLVSKTSFEFGSLVSGAGSVDSLSDHGFIVAHGAVLVVSVLFARNASSLGAGSGSDNWGN